MRKGRETVAVQQIKLSWEKGVSDKQRQKTGQRRSGGVAGMLYRKTELRVYVCLREI